MSSFFRNRIVRIVVSLFVVFNFLFLPASSLAADKLTDVQKSMLLNQPGVVFISHYDTVNLVIQTSAGYPQLAGKTYTVQSGSMGSGFIISPDGYILTNGHVVKTPDKQLAYLAIADAADDIAKDILKAEFQNQGVTPTDAEIESLMPQLIQEVGGRDAMIDSFFQSYEAGDVKVEKTKTDIYVQQGAFLSGKKLPIENGMKADVREVDFEGFSDTGEIQGKDIAIIKVSGSNMPTVKLGDSSKMQVGDKIYVIGYPAAPTFQSFLSTESQLESSTTSGIISALKTMKDGSQVLQTDTSITHGNSGGPAFNEKGEVIGIASLGAIDQKGNELAGFNYLRPSNVAKEFLSEKNVKNVSGDTDKAFSAGVEFYTNGKYRHAIKEFETALRLYPNLTQAQDYIKKSQEGMGSQTIIEKITDYLDTTTIAIALGILIVIIVIIVYIRRIAGKEKKMEQKVEQLSHDK